MNSIETQEVIDGISQRRDTILANQTELVHGLEVTSVLFDLLLDPRTTAETILIFNWNKTVWNLFFETVDRISPTEGQG